MKAEKSFISDYQWVEKVVSSSISHQQLSCSRTCFTLLLKKHKSTLDENPNLYSKVSKDFNEIYYDRFLNLK